MSMRFNSPLKRWEILAEFMRANDLRTFVEVGCKEGRTTGYILKNVPGSSVWAIDPWCPMPGHAGRQGGETYEEWDFGKIERTFWGNVEGHGGRLDMLRMTSLEAAAKMALRQFDLVFIDAAHDEENCLLDIDAWWPLVREGGFLFGHDYQHKFPGVMRAVAARFPLMRVGILPDSLWSVMRAEDME